ncbi:MAG: 3-keto-disaccharide hydrolase, partial [Bryobacteraceae bacterium]
MKSLLALLLSAAALLGQTANSITPREAADGWILLFDGQSLFGWTPEGQAKWKVAGGSIAPEGGGSGWLRSNTPFADFILKIDFRTAADGNSGVFLRSAEEGQPHQTGYELQIFDQHPEFPTGSLVHYVATKKGSIKPNQWQTFEVHARGSHFTVKLDGKTVLDVDDKSHSAGHIGLQYNQGKAIEFRNIKLKPLSLNPVFNGRDLSGWREVQPPKPAKEPAVWSV